MRMDHRDHIFILLYHEIFRDREQIPIMDQVTNPQQNRFDPDDAKKLITYLLCQFLWVLLL